MADRSITIYSANGPMLAIKFNLYAGGKAATLLPAHASPSYSVCKTFNSIFDYCENAATAAGSAGRPACPKDRIHHMGHRLPAGLSGWLAY